MLSAAPLTLPAEAVAEAKSHLRIVGNDEDGLTDRLLASAASLAERFTGQVLLVRPFTEVIGANATWVRLAACPVRAVLGIDTAPVAGAAAPLPTDAYAVDIDAAGGGWMRLTAPVETQRVQVRYEAGISLDWEGLPEPLRQGIIRLGAHLYTHRDDAAGAGPPAAVTALWRPYRRMRLT